MFSSLMLVTLALVVISSPFIYSNTCAKEEDTKTNNYNPTCQYYLAPSSIPKAGFGVYTAQSIPVNTPLQEHFDIPSILVTDEKVHFGNRIEWLHINYFWGGDGYSADTTRESVLMFGALANYHTYLYNVKSNKEMYRDDLIPRGSGSPGIGATSLHGGWQFESIRKISAGEEIFSNYGEQWLESREEGFADSVPRKSDYFAAAKALKAIYYSDTDTINNSSEVYLKKSVEESHVTDQLLSAVKGVSSLLNERSSSLIPATTNKYFDMFVKNEGITLSGDDIASNLAFETVIPRTLDWIRKEGQCLDNLIPGPSTIPDAGRGGFAQRFIPKDSLVVPAPLLQIMYHDSMFMYDLILDEKTGKMKKDTSQTRSPEPTSLQIMINYCFSDIDIDILLCPQSNAILLNHCSTRKSYGGDCEKYNKNKEDRKRGANAEVRWTGDGGGVSWDPKTQDWLKMNMTQIEDLTEIGSRGLSFDIIATRDILPGEEVFIDYGLEWEEAWESHVKHWIPPSTASYIPISQLNSSITVLRTPKELETNPYPDNAQMVCVYWEDDDDTGNEEENVDKENTMIQSGKKFTGIEHDDWEFSDYYHCRVIDLQVSVDKKIIYVVEIFQKIEQDINLIDGEGEIWTVNNYARESILFIPKKYSSDENLKGVFRHYIQIKDEMIPLQWKVNDISDY